MGKLRLEGQIRPFGLVKTTFASPFPAMTPPGGAHCKPGVKTHFWNFPEQSDRDWICDLACCWVTLTHMNELNAKLQGKDQFVHETNPNVDPLLISLKLATQKEETTGQPGMENSIVSSLVLKTSSCEILKPQNIFAELESGL